MTLLGNWLSRLLYGLLLIMLGLTAVGALVAIVGIVWTWWNPGTLWEYPFKVQYSTVVISWPNTAEARLAVCYVGLGLCTILAMALVPLTQLSRSAMTGDPFAMKNVGRLRIIACAFLLVAAGRILVPSVLPSPAYEIFQPAHPHLDFGPLFAALVLFVLAEVFREGVRLREDAEATI